MEWLVQLQVALSKSKVEQLARSATESHGEVATLISLSFHADEQVSFRAAWILESSYIQQPSVFAGYMKDLVACYPKQENHSCKRHYGKILALATGRKADKAIAEAMTGLDLDLLVATTFDWLVGEQTPVAVKSHCLNILANLVPRYPWIKDELIQTMDYLVDKESIAFFAKVKQIGKLLKVKS